MRAIVGRAGLVQYPVVREAGADDPGATFLELAASFEISMGAPLSVKVLKRSKNGCDPAWRLFDAIFGADCAWADKTAALRSACAQLSRLLDQALLQGDSAATNVAILLGVPG